MKYEGRVYTQFDTPDDQPLICDDPSLTQEHFAESCDINKIMENYTYTGIMPEKPGAVYGDFTNADDYRSILHRLMEVQENFLTMPPDIRARFANDPAQFIEFCENPANLPELQKMGLTSEAYNTETAKASLPTSGETNTETAKASLPTSGEKQA